MSSDDILVFERTPVGHRANYARTAAAVLDARALIKFSASAFYAAWRASYLVVTTFESAPGAYLSLLFARTLAGRRSTIILTRSHVRAAGWRGLLKQAGHFVLGRLPLLQRLTITPAAAATTTSEIVIEDIEFWDLPDEVLSSRATTPLSDRAVAAAGDRPIVLVTGTLERSKGLVFLTALLRARPELHDRFAFVCAGRVDRAASAHLAPLAELADLWEDRYLDDDEIYSLYRVATAVWCCYDPSYDVSSGVLGRAIQFARPTIVRAGSIIARFQHILSSGLRLDHTDPAQAADQLMNWTPVAGTPTSRYASGAAHLRRLIRAHAGLERGTR